MKRLELLNSSGLQEFTLFSIKLIKKSNFYEITLQQHSTDEKNDVFHTNAYVMLMKSVRILLAHKQSLNQLYWVMKVQSHSFRFWSVSRALFLELVFLIVFSATIYIEINLWLFQLLLFLNSDPNALCCKLNVDDIIDDSSKWCCGCIYVAPLALLYINIWILCLKCEMSIGNCNNDTVITLVEAFFNNEKRKNHFGRLRPRFTI